MKEQYDFSSAKRGAVVPTAGKTRITIYLDDEILRSFRAMSEKTGKGYQTLINEALTLALKTRFSRQSSFARSCAKSWRPTSKDRFARSSAPENAELE